MHHVVPHHKSLVTRYYFKEQRLFNDSPAPDQALKQQETVSDSGRGQRGNCAVPPGYACPGFIPQC